MSTRRLTAMIFLPLLTVAYAASGSFPELRLTPADVNAMPTHEAGSGTSGVAGIRTTAVAGDPSMAGPYTIRLSIPPNTRIQAHTHRDNRSAIVVSGVWYFGYGSVAKADAEMALPAGGCDKALDDEWAKMEKAKGDTDPKRLELRRMQGIERLTIAGRRALYSASGHTPGEASTQRASLATLLTCTDRDYLVVMYAVKGPALPADAKQRLTDMVASYAPPAK